MHGPPQDSIMRFYKDKFHLSRTTKSAASRPCANNCHFSLIYLFFQYLTKPKTDAIVQSGKYFLKTNPPQDICLVNNALCDFINTLSRLHAQTKTATFCFI